MAKPEEYSLWLENKQEQVFTKDMCHSSREAWYAVWIKGNKVYKISNFEKLNQLKVLRSLTEAANKAGVPTPEVTLKGDGLSATWYDEKKQPNKVTVAVTDKLSGHFFQLSRAGHITTLSKLINESELWVRKLAIEAVTNAIEFKITDPQGFFSANNYSQGDSNPPTPVSFIDLHVSSSPYGQSLALKELLEKINKD